MEFRGTKTEIFIDEEESYVNDFGVRCTVLSTKKDSGIKHVGLADFFDEDEETKANIQLFITARELLENVQMHIDSLDLSNFDFYNKYGFNVAELTPRTRELIEKATNTETK